MFEVGGSHVVRFKTDILAEAIVGDDERQMNHRWGWNETNGIEKMNRHRF